MTARALVRHTNPFGIGILDFPERIRGDSGTRYFSTMRYCQALSPLAFVLLPLT